MTSHYTIGLDYGTNSVRALIVDVATGAELASSTWTYAHGESGVVVDAKDPLLARQHPADYVQGIGEAVTGALALAVANKDFSAGRDRRGLRA